MRTFRILGLVVAALIALTGVAQAKPASRQTHVQLLAINDLHGHLEKTTPGSIQVGCCNPVFDRNDPTKQTGWTQKTVPAGGIAYLATHIKNLRATNPNTITVGAGDMIGASPLVSANFHDEPTIEELNTLGMDVTGVGNHEFDEGVDELQRMQYGDQNGGDGCHPLDGCQDGTPFGGALFHYLAANVFYENTDETIFPPYEIKTVDGVKIAFIGLTFEGTPTVVTPTGVAGLHFAPEIETVNTLVDQLGDEQKVKAFVVLLHQGGFQNPPLPPADPKATPVGNEYTDVNRCVNFGGPEISQIADGIDDRVSAIVSAHTHAPYICRLGGKLVTSASSFGRVITDIDLTIDTTSRRVTNATARNEIVTNDSSVTPDPDAQAILDKYKLISGPIENRVIGTITEDIKSGRDGATNTAGEQPMGDVIADAMLAATKESDFGSSVAAFMNAGGVRAGLFFAPSPTGGEQPGEVTYGEAFTVQPFGNTLVVKTCTGQQIYDVLNQQFNNGGVAGSTRIMLPSANVHYQWTAAANDGGHVVDGSVEFGDTPIDKNASYRVTMNNFMADGGDNYTVFKTCTEPLGGEVDLDAFERYIHDNSPVAPPALDRIEKVG